MRLPEHPNAVAVSWFIATVAAGFASGRSGYVMLAVGAAGFVHLRRAVRRHERRA